jgi:cysteine desulfurase
MPRLYLDHASATPWHPAAQRAHAQVVPEFFADPARRHYEGRAAHDLLERARTAAAGTLGSGVNRCIFTSGGTEAIHLAVHGAARANRTRPFRIISAAVEHSAVLAAADESGCEHVRVPVDLCGRVDLDALRVALADGALLVNLQHANHEVGTLQPVLEAAKLCHQADTLLHVDACQTVGRLDVTLETLGADFLSWSAAKFGGGRGCGGLAWSPRARFAPLLTGDEREHRRRAGLGNLPGVVAMTETLLQLAPADPEGPAAVAAARCDMLRRWLREQLANAVDDLEIHGPDDGTLPHLVAVSALYVEGQALVDELDRMGFAVHSGSSCATTSGEPSHVLVAMDALTHGHVRISFGPDLELADLASFVTAFTDAVTRLRARVAR